MRIGVQRTWWLALVAVLVPSLLILGQAVPAERGGLVICSVYGTRVIPDPFATATPADDACPVCEAMAAGHAPLAPAPPALAVVARLRPVRLATPRSHPPRRGRTRCRRRPRAPPSSSVGF